ncbi:MAG TPA: hypothetical protein VGR29_06405 [Thermomicrobiales bacterium]|nr:hypothetical protein [Thermomicrobiales bacterium]
MTTKRRRGHNEGSIYQRNDGRFVGAISLGMVDGKRRRKVIYGDTREEVRQQLVKIHNDSAAAFLSRPPAHRRQTSSRNGSRA